MDFNLLSEHIRRRARNSVENLQEITTVDREKQKVKTKLFRFYLHVLKFSNHHAIDARVECFFRTLFLNFSFWAIDGKNHDLNYGKFRFWISKQIDIWGIFVFFWLSSCWANAKVQVVFGFREQSCVRCN